MPIRFRDQWFETTGGGTEDDPLKLVGDISFDPTIDIGDVTVKNASDNGVYTRFGDNVSLPSGENHIGAIGGNQILKTVEFARPADTNAYAALDVISNSTGSPAVLTFSDIFRVNAGSGYITKARIMTDQKTNVARYRLHLFNTAPTAINDNSPYLLLWANRDKRIGYIDFTSCATEDPTNSTAAYSSNATVRLAAMAATGSNDMYGLLETLDAFTPASAQNFFIELTMEQN